MDFTTSHGAPVAVTINGQAYSVPRFLLPQMKEWSARDQKAKSDEATAHLTPDEKARFLIYFQRPPTDIFSIADWARGPDGAAEVVRQQLKSAGVPDQTIDDLIQFGNPYKLRVLSDELTSAGRAAASAADMTDQSADPLTLPPGESGGSPGTGQTNAPTSPALIPA